MSWQHDRTMSPEQFAWTLKRLDLNKGQAGRYLGYSMSSIQRFYDGNSKIPETVALLLRALIYCNMRPVVPAWPRKRDRKA